MTEITQVSTDQYHVVIAGVSLGTLEKSEIRAIIQQLDNGIYQ